jgi:hypothetical protein
VLNLAGEQFPFTYPLIPKSMKRLYYLTIAFFFSCCFTAYAQGGGTRGAVEQLSLQTRTTLDRLEDQDVLKEHNKKQLSAIKSTLDELVEKYQRSEQWLSEDYLRSLRNNYTILKAIDEKPDQTDVTRKLTFIENDLKMKNVTKAGMALSAQVYVEVLVSISVLRDNKPVQQCEVTCTTEFWFDSKPMFTFPDSSNPTSRYIPPGEYIFTVWENGRQLATKPLSIGDKQASPQQSFVIALQ